MLVEIYNSLVLLMFCFSLDFLALVLDFEVASLVLVSPLGVPVPLLFWGIPPLQLRSRGPCYHGGGETCNLGCNFCPTLCV